jgi:hypothetical protein
MKGTTALAPDMVGRQAELWTLVEHLRHVRAGTGRFVLVAGEAGVGKTRLTRTFQAQASTLENVEILRGHCFEVTRLGSGGAHVRYKLPWACWGLTPAPHWPCSRRPVNWWQTLSGLPESTAYRSA